VARKRVSPRKRQKNLRVSEKIEKLRLEGMSPEQAQGAAYGMERSGRLRTGGVYVHKRRGRSSKRK
jgi:hypothetical protein